MDAGWEFLWIGTREIQITFHCLEIRNLSHPLIICWLDHLHSIYKHLHLQDNLAFRHVKTEYDFHVFMYIFLCCCSCAPVWKYFFMLFWISTELCFIALWFWNLRLFWAINIGYSLTLRFKQGFMGSNNRNYIESRMKNSKYFIDLSSGKFNSSFISVSFSGPLEL